MWLVVRLVMSLTVSSSPSFGQFMSFFDVDSVLVVLFINENSNIYNKTTNDCLQNIMQWSNICKECGPRSVCIPTPPRSFCNSGGFRNLLVLLLTKHSLSLELRTAGGLWTNDKDKVVVNSMIHYHQETGPLTRPYTLFPPWVQKVPGRNEGIKYLFTVWIMCITRRVWTKELFSRGDGACVGRFFMDWRSCENTSRCPSIIWLKLLKSRDNLGSKDANGIFILFCDQCSCLTKYF